MKSLFIVHSIKRKEQNMSDLKHLSLKELNRKKFNVESEIALQTEVLQVASNKIIKMEGILSWINKYIDDKQEPVQMTISQIEAIVGHKVLIIT